MDRGITNITGSGAGGAARCVGIALAVAAAAALWNGSASAQVLAMTSEQSVGSIGRDTLSSRIFRPESDVDVPARLHRQIVEYSTAEAPGTVIVDTPHTYLYLVLGGGRAVRYGIGVGRDGFTWSGVKTIERKSEWPDWLPPAEMLQRQPYLPRFMAGGPGNPLGARAMYLSGSVYRIHGTNKPSSIGTHVSSGCIRMLNEDVVDLYERTRIGTKVVVLPMTNHKVVQQSFKTLASIAPSSESSPASTLR
jgi:lipoprotein-anchoring transpeptidase ErfK/SrfK